jgi:hypothetical protein
VLYLLPSFPTKYIPIHHYQILLPSDATKQTDSTGREVERAQSRFGRSEENKQILQLPEPNPVVRAVANEFAKS